MVYIGVKGLVWWDQGVVHIGGRGLGWWGHGVVHIRGRGSVVVGSRGGTHWG